MISIKHVFSALKKTFSQNLILSCCQTKNYKTIMHMMVNKRFG